MFLPQLPVHLLKSLESLSLQMCIFLFPALYFLELFLQLIFFCDLGQNLVPHGLKIRLQKLGLHLVGLTRIIADGVEVVGGLVFLQGRGGVSERLIVKGVEVVGG